MTYETFGRLIILAIFDFESKSAQKRRSKVEMVLSYGSQFF
jgi:hypothetical protein